MQKRYPFAKTRHTVICILYAALISTLAIGGVSPISTAQAAPAGVSAYFSMRVRNPKTTLRCGQTVTYHVVVEAEPSYGMPTPGPSQLGIPRGISVVGVYVEADSTDKSVGDFVGAGRIRTTVSLDSELSTLTAAKFRFKAGKPGKTTLYFDGLVGTEHAAVQLDVEVLPCDLQVKTTSLWNNGPISLVALLDGEMKADDQGRFTGTATVNWDAIFTIPDVNAACGGSRDVSATDSQADLTGDVSDSGQVTMNITFQPTTFSISGSCSSGGGSGEETMSPTPLVITVASSGGVSTQAQTLTGISGSATIIVAPVEDEAVSFIPGSQEASWNDLFGLFGALLALQ